MADAALGMAGAMHPVLLRRQRRVAHVQAQDVLHLLELKLGIAQLPSGVNFKQIFAVSILCGIGFTMSMFIASLAFEHGGLDYGSYSRLGILVGSTLAAVIGFIALRISLPNREANQSTEGL